MTPLLFSLCSPSIQSSLLPIASSQVELVAGKSTGVSIQNTSVIFKGLWGAGGKRSHIAAHSSLALSALRAE